MNSIKSRLKMLRLSNGLTIAEFADRIGVSSGNIGDWESDKRTSVPGAKALVAISKTFDVSIDWLLTGESGNRTSEAAPAWSHDKAKYVSEVMQTMESLRFEDLQLLHALAIRLCEGGDKTS